MARKIIGGGFLVLGGFFALICIPALIDPVGTKHADDADPFGTPTPRAWVVMQLAGGVVVAGVGAFILRSGK